jgi:hypothetical protein
MEPISNTVMLTREEFNALNANIENLAADAERWKENCRVVAQAILTSRSGNLMESARMCEAINAVMRG